MTFILAFTPQNIANKMIPFVVIHSPRTLGRALREPQHSQAFATHQQHTTYQTHWLNILIRQTHDRLRHSQTPRWDKSFSDARFRKMSW
jgi:hypothetical protein